VDCSAAFGRNNWHHACLPPARLKKLKPRMVQRTYSPVAAEPQLRLVDPHPPHLSTKLQTTEFPPNERRLYLHGLGNLGLAVMPKDPYNSTPLSHRQVKDHKARETLLYPSALTRYAHHLQQRPRRGRRV